MAANDDYKSYFTRNLKKVIAKFGDIALLDEIGKSNLSTALQTEIDGKASASVVATLVGEDTGKSARAISAEEVAKIVNDAPDSYDTLKEIADWISNHSESASAMNSAIVALQGKVVLGTYVPDGSEDPQEYATVKAYVEAYVAQQMANNITLRSLSVTSTGDGNVVTGVSYNNETGVTTVTKDINAIELDDISVGNVSGDGNVVTGLTYNNATGVFTPAKAVTAVLTTDLVDLTDVEVDALFA